MANIRLVDEAFVKPIWLDSIFSLKPISFLKKGYLNYDRIYLFVGWIGGSYSSLEASKLDLLVESDVCMSESTNGGHQRGVGKSPIPYSFSIFER